MIPADILALDGQDALAQCRDAFVLPSGVIYLDGNSLGCLTRAAAERARAVVDTQWGLDLITSWNKHAWIDLPVSCGEKIAPLVGAAPGQVVCCDSISVNLFKILSAALSMQPERSVVLSTTDNFPTDLYMVQGMQQLLGADRCQLSQIDPGQIADHLNDSVAVLLMSHVDFRSGQLHDMHAITRLAHQHGVLVIWDLAHSAGALPLALDECGVDFAVGCGYKYLNGGPGAPAFLYVADRHQGDARQVLSGWMGHSAPFEFMHDYEPAADIRRFLSGTPAIVSMSVLDAALDVFYGVDMQVLRSKGQQLSELFIAQMAAYPELAEFVLCSPRDAQLRGAQLAWQHPQAYAICQAMIARGVIGDFRAPDIFRVGFNALYLRFADIYRSVAMLADIMRSGEWQRPEFARRGAVT